MSFEQEKKEIIQWAQLMNARGFVTGRSGNISLKSGSSRVLLTGHDAYLGFLQEADIVVVDNNGTIVEGTDDPSSERPMHMAIHKKFSDAQVVMHSHSPYTTAFFNYFNALDIFSFEAKFYLGDVRVVPQETPTVTQLEPVLRALEASAVVVLKNHGVVVMADDFRAAFSLIELLEEQCKINLMLKAACAQGHDARELPAGKERGHAEAPRAEVQMKKYTMLSKEHAHALKDIVNADAQARALGEKYDLTCTLAVKNQDTGEVMRFVYEHGAIVQVDTQEIAEFTIIGRPDILRKVFNREIDPFVASTQGKVKTKGDFAQMSKWYPVMVHTFKLWEQAPVE